MADESTIDKPPRDDEDLKRLFAPKDIGDDIKNINERFTPQQLQQLSQMDQLGVNLLYRLYLISSTAANINKFDPDLAQKFYNAQTLHMNSLMSDLERANVSFQQKYGEL